VYKLTCHIQCLPFRLIQNYTSGKESEETRIVSRNVAYRVSSNERPEFCVDRQSRPTFVAEKPTDVA
jgi:hypothetical protein